MALLGTFLRYREEIRKRTPHSLRDQVREFGVLGRRYLASRFSNAEQSVSRAVEDGNITKILIGIAHLERARRRVPRSAGRLIAETICGRAGLERLEEAATLVSRRYPDSVMVTFLRAFLVAKRGDAPAANALICDAIMRSRHPGTVRKYGAIIARDRTIALCKTWRVVDRLARDNMTWAFGEGTSGADYADLPFVDSGDVSFGRAFDVPLALVHAEPLLQGRLDEQYLEKCSAAFDKADDLFDRLRAVSAMRRRGLRRIPSYAQAYTLARKCFGDLRSELDQLVKLTERPNSQAVQNSYAAARTLALSLENAIALGFDEDATHLESAIAQMARARWSKSCIWIAAQALAETGTDQNLAAAREIVETAEAPPTRPDDIKAYLSWAALTGEYHSAAELCERLPRTMWRKKFVLQEAEIYRCLGRFRDAERLLRDHLIETFCAPYKRDFCPITIQQTIRLIGGMGFAADTTNFLAQIPQPKNPRGVIFIAPRVIEHTRMLPWAVFAELRSMNWAVVPLVEGTAAYEPTGIEEIDRYANCISPTRRLTKNASEAFEPIEPFERDLAKGRLRWRGLNFDHQLWEEAAINRRRYNIDFTCPALQESLGELADWAEITARVIHNARSSFSKLGLRAGVFVNFNHRLPDAVFRFYCEKFGDPEDFFCVHAANGYENYFVNFARNVSTKCVVRNMTQHPESRSASFPLKDDFEAFYNSGRVMVEPAPALIRRMQKKDSPRNAEADAAERAIAAWRRGGKPVACVFGKVVCDSSLPVDGGPAHRNMKDWLNHTIQSVRNSDTLLLIKPHPHELREEIACFLTERFQDLIETEMPPNCLVLGGDWFEIEDLKDFIDLGLIYNGTTAVELGLLGIPAVLCNAFGPIDYPVGQAAPRDRDHYEQLVRFEQAPEVAPDLQARSKAWLKYMAGNKVNVDYRYHAREITNRLLYPSWWFPEDVERYLKRGDSNVYELARRAVG